MVVVSPGSSTSIAVGRVVFGGVISGEWSATRFFRGFGEKASVCCIGISWGGTRVHTGSFCVSMGIGDGLVRGVDSSFWWPVVIGRGIVGCVGSVERSLGVLCGWLRDTVDSEDEGSTDQGGLLGVCWGSG